MKWNKSEWWWVHFSSYWATLIVSLSLAFFFSLSRRLIPFLPRSPNTMTFQHSRPLETKTSNPIGYDPSLPQPIRLQSFFSVSGHMRLFVWECRVQIIIYIYLCINNIRACLRILAVPGEIFGAKQLFSCHRESDSSETRSQPKITDVLL